MKKLVHLTFCLIATTLLATTLAQTSTAQTSESTAKTSSPIAYVYVSRPTHVDGFAASASGKLTPVKGSPFSGIALSHMSVTKKFLFGASDDGEDIYTYSIASDGALKEVSKINSYKYAPNAGADCGPVGPTKLDSKGTTLYNFEADCQDSTWVQSFKIEENGELQFLGKDGAGDDLGLLFGLLGNNNYGYFIGGSNTSIGNANSVFKRQSNGLLLGINANVATPQPENPADFYLTFANIATDSTDHAALILEAVNKETSDSDGPAVLVSYTADSAGNLNTTNTYKDVPTTELFGSMSISPTGKLLAIGGGNAQNKGFQIFHFDGGSPIKHYSGLLQSKTEIDQFGWDADNHLYALGGGQLFVYTVTPTSIEEVAGSPYSIPEASSVIVLNLK
jgi:hypothetical protein